MAPLGLRKQPGGAEKRRRRKKIQEFVKSQANAILKFLKKPEKSTISEAISTRRNNNEDRDDIGDQSNNIDLEEDHLIECKGNVERIEGSEEKKEHGHLSEDIYDPGNWGNVDTRLRDILVEKGPMTRLSSDYQFPKDANGRRFSHALYIRELVNGEKVDRQWLVYSKGLDKVFCFCCKLFIHDLKNGCGSLATTGYNDWRNVSTRLKEHERSYDHMICVTRWKVGDKICCKTIKQLIS